MNTLVFEDAKISQLSPVAIGKPAYSISCGGCRLVDWLRQLGGNVTGLVRPHLHSLQELDYPDFAALDTSKPHTLLVNARLVPSLANFQQLKNLARQNQPAVCRVDSSIAAALIPTDQLPSQPTSSDLLAIQRFVDEHEDSGRATEFNLIEYPHDIVRAHLESFAENLEYLIQAGSFQQQSDGLFVGAGVETGEGLVVDNSQGPVVLDENACIGPHCFLKGPVYIGRGARVIEHSAIKDFVSIAHTTKIGGEVEASIIEPFTNKQHHGFLGHSYLGSWINLGAGTCNSDLKNTYGEVKMEYQGQRVSTGMQFIGCLVGDYAKTAINTGIFTGKTVGVCSMLYGFVTTNVPSFVNYARSFGQVTEMAPAVMVATQKRMFERRNVQQRPCDVQLIHDMYEMTRHERQLAEEPLIL